MGEVSESTMTKRKKKGRPSLLDLQKRSLKKEQQNHHQQRHNSTNVVPHDDDEDERKEKKHKLLVGLNSHLHHPTLLPNSQPFNSDPKRRKIIDPLQTVRFIITITMTFSLFSCSDLWGLHVRTPNFHLFYYYLLGIRA